MPAHPASLRVLVLSLALAACGDGGSGPVSGTGAHERSFGRLADSLERTGQRDGAEVMRAAAELIRLSGRVGSLAVAVDGATLPMSSVAVELAASQEGCPSVDCAAPPRPLRLLLAWRDADLSEALVLMADTTGTVAFPPPFQGIDSVALDDELDDEFDPGAPFDPDGAFPAIAIGVLGDRRAEAVWVATAGSLTNALLATTESCPPSTLIPSAVQYRCARADFRFAAAGAFTGGPVAAPAPGTSRQVAVASQAVPGVVLTVTGQPGALARRGLSGAVHGGARLPLPPLR